MLIKIKNRIFIYIDDKITYTWKLMIMYLFIAYDYHLNNDYRCLWK